MPRPITGFFGTAARLCIDGCKLDLYQEFVENGGQVWLCGACTKPRGITEDAIAKGATIIGAAKVVEEVAGGAKTIAFA